MRLKNIYKTHEMIITIESCIHCYDKIAVQKSSVNRYKKEYDNILSINDFLCANTDTICVQVKPLLDNCRTFEFLPTFHMI